MTNVAQVSEKLYREVYRFVRRRTDSPSLAEDLTQQVFAEAAASPTWQSGGDTVGLLFTIAKRRVIDEFRRSDRKQVPLEHAETLAAPTTEPRDARAIVSAAIDQLEPEQREVVVLKLVRGLSFNEVASHLGVTEGACKMRLRRALENLRGELEQKGIRP
jgi:RNA polymerase sigma-70 factor, ECF subfamily